MRTPHVDIIFHRLHLTTAPVGWSHVLWSTSLPSFKSHVCKYFYVARNQLFCCNSIRIQRGRSGGLRGDRHCSGQLSDRGEIRTSEYTVATLYLSVKLWHKQPAWMLGETYQEANEVRGPWPRGTPTSRWIPWTASKKKQKVLHNNRWSRTAGCFKISAKHVGIGWIQQQELANASAEKLCFHFYH